MKTQGTRITLADNLFDIVKKLGEGNPGATSVLMQLAAGAVEIDPENAFGALGPMVMLDMAGIYGSTIWLLYKDLCGESIRNVVGILRANQLGFVSQDKLMAMITNADRAALAEAITRVENRLPKFAKATA